MEFVASVVVEVETVTSVEVEVEVEVEVRVEIEVSVEKEVEVSVVLVVTVPVPDGRRVCRAETPTIIPAAISIPASAMNRSLLEAFILENIAPCRLLSFRYSLCQRCIRE